jgi:hypothetical protein
LTFTVKNSFRRKTVILKLGESQPWLSVRKICQRRNKKEPVGKTYYSTAFVKK